MSGIGIEYQGRDARDDHDIPKDLLERPRLHDGPEKGGKRREHQLDINAGGGNQDALVPLRHDPTVAYIDKEVGGKDEQHDANLVHLPAEVLAGQAVAELMDGLDEDRGDPDKRDVIE